MSRTLFTVVSIPLLAATTVVAACSGVFTFSFTEKSEKQTIEASLVPVVDQLSPLDFQFNLERQLEKRDAKSAKEVNLQAFELVVTNTDEYGEGEPNLDFLDSMSLYVDSENQSREQLAWRDSIPDGRQRVSFEVDSSINLKPYIEEGMTLETEAQGNHPDNDTTLQGVITLEVRAL